MCYYLFIFVYHFSSPLPLACIYVYVLDIFLAHVVLVSPRRRPWPLYVDLAGRKGLTLRLQVI